MPTPVRIDWDLVEMWNPAVGRKKLGVSGAGGTVPVGGTTGQVLAKNSNSNFDTGWVTPITFPSIVTFLEQNIAMVYAGAFAPEGLISGFYGSMYNQDNGFVYRKSSAGYGNTGWSQLL